MISEAQRRQRMAAAMIGGVKGGAVSKAKAQKQRANTRARIMDLPQFKERMEFTRLDVMKQTGLEGSVCTMALRDMLAENLITSRIIDEKGTLAFKSMPDPILTKAWRRTEPDLSYTPKYF